MYCKFLQIACGIRVDMPDLTIIVGWALGVAGVSPIIIAIAWEVWEGTIRPRFIPENEIEKLADEMAALYPDDPGRAALQQEGHYCHRCDSFEQAKWRRVRQEIQRRLAEQG